MTQTFFQPHPLGVTELAIFQDRLTVEMSEELGEHFAVR
jgi:hypothetical protein